MKVSQAVDYCLNYQRQNSKMSTLSNYDFILSRFKTQFEQREVSSITQEEIISFLSRMSEKCNQTTKRFRYCILNAFFNLLKKLQPDSFIQYIFVFAGRTSDRLYGAYSAESFHV